MKTLKLLLVLLYISLFIGCNNENENVKAQLITLTSEENDKVSLLYQVASPDIKMEFNNLFVQLTNKINSPEFINISNPEFLYQSEEYKSLLNFCKTQGRQDVWSILIEKIFNEQEPFIAELCSMIFMDITAENYGYLMDEVKAEWAANCYDENGNYINPSPQQNVKNYVRKILATIDSSQLKLKLL
ncbi:MAG: hypothetical protein LLF95_00905 [Bacteroidales bacterium]|nr:hypothetical protein [Bacteroidales bacterium]